MALMRLMGVRSGVPLTLPSLRVDELRERVSRLAGEGMGRGDVGVSGAHAAALMFMEL